MVASRASLFRYEVYDLDADRLGHFWDCADDEAARSEFSVWYNIMNPAWERRSLQRVFLVQTGVVNDGGLYVGRPEGFRGVMADWEVRLSFVHFSMVDPPSDDAAVAALLLEFDRLDAIDGERLARFSNLPGVDVVGSGADSGDA